MPKLNLPKKSVKNTKNTEPVTNDVFVIEIDKEELKIGLYTKKDNNIQNIGHQTIVKEKYNFENSLCTEENLNLVNSKLDKITALYPTKSKSLILGITQRNIISYTTTVRIKRINNEEKISKKEIDDFVEKIINNCKNEITGDRPDITIELLNSDIIFTKVDGYITKQPEGMRGTTLEISIFVNFINADYLEELINFANKIGLNLVTIASGIYAFNKALNNNIDSNYLLINSDYNTTNLGVVFAGELFYGTFVNFGYSDIKNYLAVKHNLNQKETEDAISQKVVDEQIIESSKKIYDYLYELVSLRLQNAKKVKLLPENIKITGKKSLAHDKQLLINNLASLNFKNEPVSSIINTDNFDFFDKSVQKVPKYSYTLNVALAKFCFNILNLN